MILQRTNILYVFNYFCSVHKIAVFTKDVHCLEIWAYKFPIYDPDARKASKQNMICIQNMDSLTHKSDTSNLQ